MLELQCHDLLGVQCRAFMKFLWVSTIFKRNGHTQQTICTVGEQKHLCTLFCSCSDSCRTTMKLALTVKIHWWKQWRSNWRDRGHNICDRGSKESNSKTFFISLSLRRCRSCAACGFKGTPCPAQNFKRFWKSDLRWKWRTLLHRRPKCHILWKHDTLEDVDDMLDCTARGSTLETTDSYRVRCSDHRTRQTPSFLQRCLCRTSPC